MSEMIDRVNPKYTKAIIKKKAQKDQKEIVIRNKIKDDVSEGKIAHNTFPVIKEVQIEYLKDMVRNADNPKFIHDKTQETIKKISDLLHSQIVDGSKALDKVPKGSPTLVMTNHFGGYKLFSIDHKRTGVNIPGYDTMYPYLMYFAALNPVAEAIGDNLYYVSEDYPLVFGQIHTAAGFLYIPPPTIEVSGGRTQFLEDQTNNRIQKRSNSAFVNFPEGGTSGKYSGLGPYDLDPFKTGGYVVAANLGIHVIPAAQYFHPEKGFQIKIFEPFIPEKTDKEGYGKMAENNRVQMQEWLDKQQKQ